MPYIRSLGPCDCCGGVCPGCRWAILVYFNGGASNDDLDVYLNGTLLYTVRESTLNRCGGVTASYPAPCRAWLLKPTTLASPLLDPADPVLASIGCDDSGGVLLTEVPLAALDAPAETNLKVELHSVVFNECANQGIAAVYRVCDDDHLVFYSYAAWSGFGGDLPPYGSDGFEAIDDGKDAGGADCATVDNSATVYPAHTDREGATQVLCGGDNRIPYTLNYTFTGTCGYPDGSMEFDWPMNFWHVPGVNNEPKMVCAFTPDEFQFSYFALAFATVTVLSYSPFHATGSGTGAGGCSFTVDITE
jgi:hypothetical protein